VLAPEAVIAGRVTWKGQPGRRSRLWAAAENAYRGTPVTAADGAYRLDHLSAGDLQVGLPQLPSGAVSSPVTLSGVLAGPDPRAGLLLATAR